MKSIRVYYRMAGSNEIKSGFIAAVSKGRVQFTDGRWNPIDSCFLTKKQCQNYHRAIGNPVYDKRITQVLKAVVLAQLSINRLFDKVAEIERIL